MRLVLPSLQPPDLWHIFASQAKVLNAAFIIFVTRMVSEKYVKVPPVCIVGKQIQQFCIAQYFWQVTVDPCVVLRYLSVSSMGCPMPISLSQVDCLEILMLSQIVFSFSLLIKVVIYNGRVLHLEGNLLPPSWLRALATINTIVQWMGTCRLELYNSIKSGALVVLCWFSILNIMYCKVDVVKSNMMNIKCRVQVWNTGQIVEWAVIGMGGNQRTLTILTLLNILKCHTYLTNTILIHI